MPLFRQGMAQVASALFNTQPLLEATTQAELLALAASQAPSLVLVATNVLLPSAEPVALLAELRELNPRMAVIFIVAPTTPRNAVLRLLRQNVSGLLLNTAVASEVCETIGQVRQHGRFYNDYALSLLQRQLHCRDKAPRATASFSARQLEVLHLIAEELSNEEIAAALYTSVRTVEYHRSQMLHKAGTRTTLGLILFAQYHGLLATHEPAGASGSTKI